MRNLRTTTMVAAALVAGLVLGGIGIATAQTHGTQLRLGAMDATTSVVPPSVDSTEPATSGSGDTTQPVTPVSGDTTQPVMPGSGEASGSAPATDTVRPPMPPQAKGHAYGRVISHPHSGLHRGMRLGKTHGSFAAHARAHGHGHGHMNATSPSAATKTRGNSGHTGGSMMGR